MDSGWRLLTCAAVTSALVYASFFPIGFWGLAWVAFVPWMSLAAAERHPRLYLLAWLGALPVALGCISWVPVADWRMTFAWLLLGLYYSLHYPLALYLVRLLWRGLGMALTFSFPLAWVAMEYVRSNLAGGFVSLVAGHYQHDWPGGFAWYLLGHSQHELLEAIQVADLGGAYAVSFVVAMVNGLLYEAVAARWEALRFSRKSLLAQALFVGAVLGATFTYGSWRLRQDTGEPGPRVALLQGSIDQRIRNEGVFSDRERREEAWRVQVREYAQLCRLAQPWKPDLFVWPETANPGMWKEVRPGEMEPDTADMARELVRAFPGHHLLGMAALEWGMDGKVREYNSAILVSPGPTTFLGRYDKAHRVPFGEYIPFREKLSFLSWLAPYPGDYGVEAGAERTRFEVAGHSFGVLICYEDTVAALAREYAGVRFLLNISNDGWFDGTSEHEQHLVAARFRAVEMRRPLARAVNMGVSAVIDGSGRVLRPGQAQAGSAVWVIPAGSRENMPSSEWGRFKKVTCLLLAQPPLDTRWSLYATVGDVFALSVCATLLLAILAASMRPRR
jgi:apolipoprotein N-acyltransferase